MNLEDAQKYIEDGANARLSIDTGQLFEIGNIIASAFRNGKKIIIFGNGGSAADAQHIAAEFLGRFERERRSLPAIALHANSSAMTAISNDYSFESVYERQVEAFAAKGDIVIGISTSGNSPNVIKGVEKANGIGCTTISMTGESGGKLSGICNYRIRAKSNRTPIIQEVHITIGHLLSKIVEDII